MPTSYILPTSSTKSGIAGSIPLQYNPCGTRLESIEASMQEGDALFVQALSQAADDTDMICDKETF
jgi:hypothetical protein